MIDLDFLESLIRAIDESTIDSVEIERGGTRIRVSKTPPAPENPASSSGSGAAVYVPASAGGESAAAGNPTGSAPSAAPTETGAGEKAGGEAGEEADDGLVEIASPMVGTFYRAPAPDAPPYVEPGDRVALGDTLCIIEAMKLMNELDSEVAGTIVEICVENAEPVEYGQALFRIEPA